VLVEIAGIPAPLKSEIADFGDSRREECLDGYLENLIDFSRLQYVSGSLAQQADKGSDDESGMGNEIVQTAKQLHRIGRNTDLFFHLAQPGLFETLPLVRTAAGKRDLTSMNIQVLRALRKKNRVAVALGNQRNHDAGAAQAASFDLIGIMAE